MQNTNIDICFIIAMAAEAKNIIKGLLLAEDESFAPNYPMRAWYGKFNEKSIAIVINGKDNQYELDLIGTQAATLTTQLAIEYFHPSLIISAGTAGAFAENNAKIGEVYLSYPHIVFHDRRVDIPGWNEMGIGRYPVYDVREMAITLGLKTGIVSTGNSLDMPETDEQSIRQLNGEIKEMEAAAVAWVASLHHIPMFCIKAVTDLVDIPHPTHEQFLSNLKMAVNNLSTETLRILKYLTTR